MLLTIKDIKHKKQLQKYSCVSACVSIVTGLREYDVIKSMCYDSFSTPFPYLAAIRFLTRIGVYAEKVSGVSAIALSESSIYLITCPSNVSAGSAHMIIGFVKNSEMTIIDPSSETDDGVGYTSRDWLDGDLPCFEYYLLTDCNIKAEFNE